jgi:hypothetical protein
VWPEYGTYLGPFLLALALLGIFFSLRRHAWVAVLFAVAFLLMLGHVAPWAPWALLKGHVFPFKEMRVPSRFRCEVSMFLAVFVGFAVDGLPRLLSLALPGSRRMLRTGILAIALIGVGDMCAVGLEWFRVCFNNPPEQVVAVSPHLYVHGEGLASMIDQPRQNRIRLECWDEWGFGAGAPLWEGDVPQARATSSAVHVANVRRTQNTFAFDVDAQVPSRVLLNSTYDRGWTSTVGTVQEQSKLLVVDVPAGHSQVLVKYWPRWIGPGLLLTAIGLCVSIAFWFRRRA